MEIVLVLISQVFAVALGHVILSLFFKKDMDSTPLIEVLALSYVVGFGLIPLYMILLYLAGIGFSYRTLYAPILLFICIGYAYLLYRDRRISINLKYKKFDRMSLVFISLITFEIIHSFFRALIKPVESFDSVASFAIKAKIFFLAKCIPPDYFHNIATNFPHPYYPLMIPLQETFCFISMGSFNDMLVNIIFPMHFLALVILFYFNTKAVTSRMCALVFTFLIASLNELNRFSTMGYTDIHFALYVCIGFLYWYRYVTSKKENALFFYIPAIFSAFAIFTKDTGYMVPALYLLLSVIYRREKKVVKEPFIMYIRYLAVTSLLILPWIYLRIKLGPSQTFIKKDILDMGYFICLAKERILPILYEFQANAFGLKKWNMLWPVFMTLFIINYRWSWKTPLKYITALIVSVFILYFLFYLGVDPLAFGRGRDYAFSLRSGMNRHLIHALPLIMFWLACLFKEMCHDEK